MVPRSMVVYHQCQCSLFKQFTTGIGCRIKNHPLFIINVNVLFLSNSQRKQLDGGHCSVVYHQCQCSLFKQFTTQGGGQRGEVPLFIINVNVLFLSNSQQCVKHYHLHSVVYHQCQCSLFKQFTTVLDMLQHFLPLFIINVNVLFLSNSQPRLGIVFQQPVVYHQCQCSLFKQFTTEKHRNPI